MSRKGKQRTSQLVQRMVTVGAEVLVQQLSLGAAQAEECMRGTAYALCREMGGSEIYFPVALELRLQRRDAALQEAAEVSSPAELARSMGTSVRTVQRRLKAPQRALNPRAGSFIERLVGLGIDVLCGSVQGLDASAVESTMQEIAYRLCRDLGGCELYFPLDMEWHITQRDRQIWAEYRIERGVSNVLELSQRYGLTVRTIQSILAWMRTQEAAKQIDMFERDAA